MRGATEIEHRSRPRETSDSKQSTAHGNRAVSGQRTVEIGRIICLFAKELSLVSWLLCMCRVGLTARDKVGVGCPRAVPGQGDGRGQARRHVAGAGCAAKLGRRAGQQGRAGSTTRRDLISRVPVWGTLEHVVRTASGPSFKTVAPPVNILASWSAVSAAMLGRRWSASQARLDTSPKSNRLANLPPSSGGNNGGNHSCRRHISA